MLGGGGGGQHSTSTNIDSGTAIPISTIRPVVPANSFFGTVMFYIRGILLY